MHFVARLTQTLLSIAAVWGGCAIAQPSDAAPPASASSKADGITIQVPTPAKQQVIAIFPDRTTGRDWGLRYLREGVEDLNRIQPDAVFTVGDLVQGYTRLHEEYTRQQEEYLSIVGKLNAPLYPTSGNHDVVSGARSSADRTYADLYREKFGPLYYATELELVTIIVMFTEDGDGQIKPGFSDAQLAWLAKTLESAAARNRPIALLMHRPLWHDRATKWEERIDPLLEKYGVDWVIAGHYHALQDEGTRGSTRYLILGTCGGSIDQHPLAGQLQHLTFLVVHENGSIEPYHQVVGTTLPVDWIRLADQTAAFRLKGNAKIIQFEDALIDPLEVAASGSLHVLFENPLDIPISISARAVRDFPVPWEVGTQSWISRTPIDIFNPFVTDINTPFVFSPTPTVTIPPRGSAKLAIPYSADSGPAPCAPPEIDFVAHFTDSQNRTVPVHLRRRLPIARTVTANDGLQYPIAAWDFSEYDETEANASARFAFDSTHGLSVEVNAPDELLSMDGPEQRPAKDAVDPARDMIRIDLGTGASARSYVAFIRTGANLGFTELKGESLVPCPKINALLDAALGQWTLRFDLAPDALPAERPLTVNIGIADNDGHYHTQWRWLAPKSFPAKLLLPSEAPAPPAPR